MGTQSKKINEKQFALTWVFVVFNPFFILIPCRIIFFLNSSA